MGLVLSFPFVFTPEMNLNFNGISINKLEVDDKRGNLISDEQISYDMKVNAFSGHSHSG
jgi:hypothetical protein